jgi:predicted RNA-binding Zn-ribbon protein involved in translation (DUF1610 family)
MKIQIIIAIFVLGILQNSFGIETSLRIIENSDTLKNGNQVLNPKDTAKIYTCPMHPEISWSKPDKCPKCGMDLVLKKSELQVKTEYTCSMHPDVISDKPGKCPKCGMDLVVKGSSSGMGMGCMGMMHGHGKKNVWMYIAGGAMMIVMMTFMVLKVMR